MIPPRRKKWTEAEEKTLIDRYGEMVASGTLLKMKTREKKYRPIAVYVNSVHHLHDPVAYPWQWTWKDVSTKVQNMRHQYLLVKQKIKKPESSEENSAEEFDWAEGTTHWSNFLRYKEVFGDVVASYCALNNVNGNQLASGEGFVAGIEFYRTDHVGDGTFEGINKGDNGRIMDLGFECDGGERAENHDTDDRVKGNNKDGFGNVETDPNGSNLKQKRKALKGLENKALGLLANQLRQLREMESRFERRDADRQRDRQKKEKLWMDSEQVREKKFEEMEKKREKTARSLEKMRNQRMQDREAMEKEIEDRVRRRREEALSREREWEERMNRRRSEWQKRMDEMLSHHRAEMAQMQSRILHEQQNFTGQLLAFFSQWTAHPTGLSDHSGTSSHYFSHMMQNLHHVNDMVHDGSKVGGENQDDQFIVDE